MTWPRRQPEDNFQDKTFVLQDRDGDYVLDVTSTGLETAKLFFTFTKDKTKAKRFTYKDLWWKLATTCIGIHFMQGFAGGRAVEVET